MIRLRRTVLYVPADKPRALEKAATLPADVVIIDLEDSVSPANKESARAAAIAAAAPIAASGKEVAVRINGSDTPWYHGDVTELRRGGFAALVLPKVRTPIDVKRVALRSGMCVWPMMEVAQAILEAKGIAEAAASTGEAALILGTNDLAAELGVELPAARQPIVTSLQLAVLAAKAAGIDAIDGVVNVLGDGQRLRQETNQARSFGFAGKTVIHPSQIDMVNQLFSPRPQAIEDAGRVIEAMREAEADGAGVATLDGRLVESLHARAAERVLAVAAAIAERERLLIEATEPEPEVEPEAQAEDEAAPAPDAEPAEADAPEPETQAPAADEPSPAAEEAPPAADEAPPTAEEEPPTAVAEAEAPTPDEPATDEPAAPDSEDEAGSAEKPATDEPVIELADVPLGDAVSAEELAAEAPDAGQPDADESAAAPDAEADGEGEPDSEAGDEPQGETEAESESARAARAAAASLAAAIELAVSNMDDDEDRASGDADDDAGAPAIMPAEDEPADNDTPEDDDRPHSTEDRKDGAG